MVSFTDKSLVCKDCGNSFVFTAGEQQFFQSRGLLHEPARCPSCRALRRRNNSQDGGAARTMYPVVCDECGRQTEVPFQPRQGRPVYCRECFARHRQA